jgi:hypothetical protein
LKEVDHLISEFASAVFLCLKNIRSDDMVYRPRYLDPKRNKKFVRNAFIKGGKMFFEYTDGSMIVLDSYGIHPVNREDLEIKEVQNKWIKKKKTC